MYDTEKAAGAPVVQPSDVHAEYGGVVPELASRDHIQNIAFKSLGAAGCTPKDLRLWLTPCAWPCRRAVGWCMCRAFFGLCLGHSCARHSSYGGALLLPCLKTTRPNFPCWRCLSLEGTLS